MKNLRRMTALILVLALCLLPCLRTPVSAAEKDGYMTLEEAGAYTREQMAARTERFSVSFRVDDPRPLKAEQVWNLLLQETIRHTGVPTQGDTLRWSYLSNGYYVIDDFDGTTHWITVEDISFKYYTNAQEEQALAEKVDELLQSFELDNKTEYEKVKAIYDYVCGHVEYDMESAEMQYSPNDVRNGHAYTAYGALMEGLATCQGYSSLMYYMLLRAGIDNRLIAGNLHGWNVVRVEDSWYYLDATWDAGRETYNWFLSGSAKFRSYGHSPYGEYTTLERLNAYPVSSLDYGAPETATGSGQCRSDVYWNLDAAGTLTISGTGEGPESPSTEDLIWGGLRGYVKKIVIEEGITSIGSYAFYNCPSLEQVVIADTVTHIGSEAFGLCDNLKFISIPDSVTTVDGKVFTGCARLETVVLSKNMTTISDGMFFECQMLKDIVIPESVTEVGEQAFANCTALEKLVIPGSVTKLGRQAMAAAFAPGAEITVPESVTEVGTEIFAWSNLRHVAWNASAPTIRRWTFYFMPYLETVTVGGTATELEEEAFANAASLRSVHLSGSITKMGNSVFLDCLSLKEVELPGKLQEIPQGAFVGCESLEEIVIPKRVQRICESAFNGCKSLRKVTIPGSVKTIAQCAFGWCASLETVIFMGDAPEIFKDELGIPAFHGAPFHAYYPEGNPTWTEDKKLSYGGINTQWSAQENTHPVHTPSGTWQQDDQAHWQLCTVCEEEMNFDAHAYSSDCDSVCDTCGYTRQAQAHAWQEAACEAPKTCQSCGMTEGEALGHQWQEADCEAPKTCRRCSKTEGAPLAHDYKDGICTGCGAERPAYILGDVNGDGKINVADAMVTLRYAVKRITANDLNVEAADVNSDGKVNVTDAMQILRFAVKKITEFKPAK